MTGFSLVLFHFAYALLSLTTLLLQLDYTG